VLQKHARFQTPISPPDPRVDVHRYSYPGNPLVETVPDSPLHIALESP